MGSSTSYPEPRREEVRFQVVVNHCKNCSCCDNDTQRPNYVSQNTTNSNRNSIQENNIHTLKAISNSNPPLQTEATDVASKLETVSPVAKPSVDLNKQDKNVDSKLETRSPVAKPSNDLHKLEKNTIEDLPPPFSESGSFKPANTTNNDNWKDNKRRMESFPYRDQDNKEKNSHTRPPLGYKYLENISQESANVVVNTLHTKKASFLDLVTTQLRPDLLVLVVRLLSKMSESQFTEKKKQILKCVWCETFNTYLEKHIIKQSEQKKERYLSFVDDLIILYESVEDLFPDLAIKILPKLLNRTQVAIDCVQTRQNILFDTNTTMKLEKLLLKYGPYTDHFRNLNLLPTPNDIYKDTRLNEANVTLNMCKNEEHYLHILFTILREDFVLPLRNGIMNYLKSRSVGIQLNIVDNVKIYSRVAFMRSSNMNFLISINNNDNSNSTTLQNGSLLCFTRNNFRDIFSLTCIEHHMEKKYILALLWEGCRVPSDLYDGHFIMVQLNMFVDPYIHMMKILQSMTVDTLPMKEYIIKNRNLNFPPRYLRGQIYSNSYQVQQCTVGPLLYSSWPDAAQLGLDEYQYQAFKKALTSEFALIHGSPGTGKTFLGLKILEVLLQNAKLWYKTRGVILVVCVTISALQQYLEGILHCTDKVVYLGKQSRCKILKKFSIEEWRCKHPKAMDIFDENIQMAISEANQIQAHINAIDSGRGILSLKSLMGVMHMKHFRTLVNDKEFVKWLEGYNNRSFTSQNLGSSEDDHRDDKSLNQDIVPVINFAVEFEALKKEKEYLELHGHHTSRYEELDIQLAYYSLLLEEQRNQDVQANKHLAQSFDLWCLQPAKRRNLYWHWVGALRKRLLLQLCSKTDEYHQAVFNFYIKGVMHDAEILKDVNVVGIISADIAMFRPLLEKLETKIVIVDDAEAVPEVQAVASLSSACEHLILIGNKHHVDLSSHHHKINSSLFKRMVRNGMDCEQLDMQHRMQPKIAQLMTAFYPEILDHPSTDQYPGIHGMEKSVFFVNHNHPEDDLIPGTNKFRNMHEGMFLLALAQYLVQQGHKSNEITILTMYWAQVAYMNTMLRKYSTLKEITISILEHYTGKENRIVLVSLVCSNNDDSIRLHTTHNLVCMLLSRAREGLYIIGNMDSLIRNSEIWMKVKEILIQQNSIGPNLVLQCRAHSEQCIPVETAAAFDSVKCPIICNTLLQCGHHCKRTCHAQNPNHKGYKCREPCSNKTPKDCYGTHKCLHLCFQSCDPCMQSNEIILDCGHMIVVSCNVMRSTISDMKKLPMECTRFCEALLPCGHICSYKCHAKTDPQHIKYKCDLPCAKIQPCGHPCIASCNTPCTTECKESVVLKCGHNRLLACDRRFDADTLEKSRDLLAECREPCRALLLCGHTCSGTCGTCHQGRVHVPCKEKCHRFLICGHRCNNLCCISCPPCTYNCFLSCNHSKCTHKCGEQCKPCREHCTWQCEHLSCNKLCFEECDREPCYEPCRLQLSCGHPCLGFCGDPCPQLCRVCNHDIVSKHTWNARFVTLDCNHIVDATEMEKIMNQTDNDVSLKHCPVCGWNIVRTRRYRKQVRRLYADIVAAKSALQYRLKTDTARSTLLINQLQSIECQGYDAVLTLKNDLLMKADLMNAEQLHIYMTMLDNAVQLIPKNTPSSKSTFWAQFTWFIQLLGERKDCMSAQVVSELDRELARLARLITLNDVEHLPQFTEYRNISLVSTLYDEAVNTLQSFNVFSEEQDRKVKRTLMTLYKMFKGNLPTLIEHHTIKKLLGMERGSWVKCSAGHVHTFREDCDMCPKKKLAT